MNSEGASRAERWMMKRCIQPTGRQTAKTCVQNSQGRCLGVGRLNAGQPPQLPWLRPPAKRHHDQA